jgi:hypothetical protein
VFLHTARPRLAKARSDIGLRAVFPLTLLITGAPHCQPGLGPGGVRFYA